MPRHNYKELFDRVNESRISRGVKPLSWPEFLGKDPKEVNREKRKMQDYIEPDPPKTFQRPPAVYDNKSIYDKYGV
jgi:hypothetical protein